MWPLLTALALLALAAVHFGWRRKFLRARAAARLNADNLNAASQRVALELQSQRDTVFNSMIEGLLLLDERGRIQLANRAFASLFGISTDIRGQTIVEALRLPELAELVEAVTPERQLLDHELRLPGLSERWLQINAAAIADGEGGRRGTILVFHELTRVKQLERTRQEFVANVSHELRTPLSLIKGYVETLLDGARNNPEVAAKFLHTIQRNAERLQFLIEDLLTISEMESGRLKMNLQPVALRPLADKVLADFSARAGARRITLANQLPEASVRADTERLQQVFGNLVDNAIKYGRNDGTVVVGGEAAEDGMFQLCVQDDGPGIPAESLERVFERFYRVDKARSREQGGTGLGLSIVKHIVQSHGGKVWAKSDPGKGTAFFFTLPVEPASGQESQPGYFPAGSDS